MLGDDDLHPLGSDTAPIELDEALERGEVGPRRPELLRFAWASAALQFLPALHQCWAESADRALRRAVMRSPELPPEIAELVVAHRRSGMHTLGANPAAPIELLGSNPSALRRRTAIDDVAPGGLADIAERPNRHEVVALGSPTVDLVLALSPSLDLAHAELLASRRTSPIDPWTAALLVARFGDRIAARSTAHSSRERTRATAQLATAAERWVRAAPADPG